LLDEATSALDNSTESLVYDSLKRRSITLITIAHRLDVALKSDQVIVMSNGTIAEAGHPETLLSQGGLFAELVTEDGTEDGTKQ
jgi:ATP-binding cassette subfamily B protein